jgi:alpha-beta hydrolase superfamily lysophospholipase
MFMALKEYIAGRKCNFYLPPAPEKDRNEIVVLIHGLIHRSTNLYSLGKFFRNAGYSVYVYDYRTTKQTISRHAGDFKLFLEKIASESPPEMKINIISHSLGGIVTRETLGHLAPGNDWTGEILVPDRLKRIVMLAPPNLGSDAARRLLKLLPASARLLKPLSELSSDASAYVHSVPVPENVEIGVIAGRFDLEVATHRTPLVKQKDHIILFAEHTFMMYMPSVRRAALRFLETGSFAC